MWREAIYLDTPVAWKAMIRIQELHTIIAEFLSKVHEYAVEFVKLSTFRAGGRSISLDREKIRPML
jgi:hypothetical protein